MIQKDNLVVVIRTINERTFEYCQKAALEEVKDNEKILIIHDLPFADAHYESISFALERNTKWALFLDADILLRKNAIEVMVSEAEKISIPFFMLNFPILDYGFNGYTFGVHFYNVKNLTQSTQFYDIAKNSQRPEYETCKQMAKIGLQTLSANTIIGLHGYEQFYRDLYRTTFVRAVKYKKLQNYMMRLYRVNYNENNDFKVMFWSLIDGILFSENNDKVPLEKSFLQDRTENTLKSLELNEKDILDLDVNFVDKVIDSFQPGAEYNKIRHFIFSEDFYQIPIPDNSIENNLRKIYTELIFRIKRSILILLRGW